MARILRSFILTVGAGLLLAGCADDGGAVRVGPPAGSAVGGGGSQLSNSDLGRAASEPELVAAVATYRAYVLREAATIRTRTTVLTDAVRSRDLVRARAAYAPSRLSWERIEPVAGLVPELDGVLDSRVDDVSGADDPQWTGWHRIEYLLWRQNSTAAARPLADRLDRDLVTLERRLRTVPITPKAIALGAGALIEEVSQGKITGEEDRYSHTDLWDFAGNVQGAQAAYSVFAARLKARDAGLAATVDRQFATVEASLAPYRSGEGYQPYPALAAADKARMQAQLAALAESLAQLPAAVT